LDEASAKRRDIAFSLDSVLTMDAREHLRGLVGQTIHTLARRQPNRILEIRGDDVIVATGKSPSGEPVPIAEVQAAIDVLERDGEVRLDVKTVGYRSAFVGAVLGALPGAAVMTDPPRVRLKGR
jgi:hypothetical protein